MLLASLEDWLFPFLSTFCTHVRNFLSNKLQGGGGDKKVPSYRRQCYNWKRKEKKVVLLWTLCMCGGVKQLASRVGGVSHSLSFPNPTKPQVVWEDFTRERLGILFFHNPSLFIIIPRIHRYSSYIRISTITRIKVYIWLMFVVATCSFIWMNFSEKIEQTFVKFCTRKPKFPLLFCPEGKCQF